MKSQRSEINHMPQVISAAELW